MNISLTCDSVLTRYLPKAKARKEKNLLSNSDGTQDVEEEVFISLRHSFVLLI